MENQLTIVGDRWRSLDRIKVELLFCVLVALENPIPHVLLRVNRPELRKHGIAAGMVAVMMRVDDESDRLARHLPDLRDDSFGERDRLSVAHLRVVVVIDDEHTFVRDEHTDVAAHLAHVWTRRRDDGQLVGELVHREEIRRHRRPQLRLRGAFFVQQKSEDGEHADDPHQPERVTHPDLLSAVARPMQASFGNTRRRLGAGGRVEYSIGPEIAPSPACDTSAYSFCASSRLSRQAPLRSRPHSLHRRRGLSPRPSWRTSAKWRISSSRCPRLCVTLTRPRSSRSAKNRAAKCTSSFHTRPRTARR